MLVGSMPVDPSPFYPDSQTTPKNQHAGCGWYCLVSTMLQHQVSFREEWVHQLPEGTAVLLRNGLRENPPENHGI